MSEWSGFSTDEALDCQAHVAQFVEKSASDSVRSILVVGAKGLFEGLVLEMDLTNL